MTCNWGLLRALRRPVSERMYGWLRRSESKKRHVGPSGGRPRVQGTLLKNQVVGSWEEALLDSLAFSGIPGMQQPRPGQPDLYPPPPTLLQACGTAIGCQAGRVPGG